MNGPNVWPGANYIVDERGARIDLSKKPLQARLCYYILLYNNNNFFLFVVDERGVGIVF